MNMMSTMEHTLHTGPTKVAPSGKPRKMRWPADFRRPVEAALHLGTPKPLVPRRRYKVVSQPVGFILD